MMRITYLQSLKNRMNFLNLQLSEQYKKREPLFLHLSWIKHNKIQQAAIANRISRLERDADPGFARCRSQQSGRPLNLRRKPMAQTSKPIRSATLRQQMQDRSGVSMERLCAETG